MKQAILITAYKDLDFLPKIVNAFDEDFDFYIHVDKKCKEPYPHFTHKGKVVIVSNYRIEWGSWKYIWSIYDLLALAHSSGNYSYFHLISGNDYPIKSTEQFKQFFSPQNDQNYIEYHHLPRPSWVGEGGIERIRYYWIGNQWHDIRHHGTLTRWLVKVQRKLKVRRKWAKDNNLYGGGVFFSISNTGAESILSVPTRKIHHLTRFTHAPEEITTQTILLNTPGLNCINDSLRLILWEGDAASPKTLTEQDFETIRASNAFFARKMDPVISQKLLSMIDNELLNA